MTSAATVTWSGDVDLSNAAAVRADLDAALAARPDPLILDLARLGFIDSMGLSLLVHARSECLDRGAALVLRGVTPRALALLDKTGLASLFAFEESVTGVRGDRLDTLPAETPLAAEPDDKFDRIAVLTRRILGVPTALVSLVDTTQQVFPGAVGLPAPWQDSRSTPLTHSFCQYVVAGEKPLIVNDARQYPALSDNRAIPDLGVVAYAGMPLLDLDGVTVGSLCAIDSRPRTWTDDEIGLLRELAAVCSAELQIRTSIRREALAAERNRMAADLQQRVIGDLLTLAMDLGRARSLRGDTTASLDAAIDKIDGILAALRNAVFSR